MSGRSSVKHFQVKNFVGKTCSSDQGVSKILCVKHVQVRAIEDANLTSVESDLSKLETIVESLLHLEKLI